MNILLCCYYGFTGTISFADLYKDYAIMSETQKRVFELDLKESLEKAGLFINNVSNDGFSFILGAKLKEEIMTSNEITPLNISDYLFLLNQGKSKSDADKIFKDVNNTLMEKGCYYFNPQKYSYLTYSLIK